MALDLTPECLAADGPRREASDAPGDWGEHLEPYRSIVRRIKASGYQIADETVSNNHLLPISNKSFPLSVNFDPAFCDPTLFLRYLTAIGRAKFLYCPISNTFLIMKMDIA